MAPSICHAATARQHIYSRLRVVRPRVRTGKDTPWHSLAEGHTRSLRVPFTGRVSVTRADGASAKKRLSSVNARAVNTICPPPSRSNVGGAPASMRTPSVGSSTSVRMCAESCATSCTSGCRTNTLSISAAQPQTTLRQTPSTTRVRTRRCGAMEVTSDATVGGEEWSVHRANTAPHHYKRSS